MSALRWTLYDLLFPRDDDSNSRIDDEDADEMIVAEVRRLAQPAPSANAEREAREAVEWDGESDFVKHQARTPAPSATGEAVREVGAILREYGDLPVVAVPTRLVRALLATAPVAQHARGDEAVEAAEKVLREYAASDVYGARAREYFALRAASAPEAATRVQVRPDGGRVLPPHRSGAPRQMAVPDEAATTRASGEDKPESVIDAMKRHGYEPMGEDESRANLRAEEQRLRTPRPSSGEAARDARDEA